MDLHIDRFCNSSQMGTFGKLRDTQTGRQLAHTIEQPWNNNKNSPAGVPFFSCIPKGVYELQPYDSPKYGKTFLLVNAALGVVAEQKDKEHTWDRYLCIAFHRGNFARNFQGCIGVGDKLSADAGEWMVTNTRNTVERVLKKMYEDTVNRLIITGAEI